MRSITRLAGPAHSLDALSTASAADTLRLAWQYASHLVGCLGASSPSAGAAGAGTSTASCASTAGSANAALSRPMTFLALSRASGVLSAGQGQGPSGAAREAGGERAAGAGERSAHVPPPPLGKAACHTALPASRLSHHAVLLNSAAPTCDQLARHLEQARVAKGKHVARLHAAHRCRHCAARLAADLGVLVQVGIGQQQAQRLARAQAVHHHLHPSAMPQMHASRAGGLAGEPGEAWPPPRKLPRAPHPAPASRAAPPQSQTSCRCCCT